MDKGRNMMICPNGFSIDQMVNGNIGIRIHDVLYEIRVTPHTNAIHQTKQPYIFAQTGVDLEFLPTLITIQT